MTSGGGSLPTRSSLMIRTHQGHLGQCHIRFVGMYEGGSREMLTCMPPVLCHGSVVYMLICLMPQPGNDVIVGSEASIKP